MGLPKFSQTKEIAVYFGKFKFTETNCDYTMGRGDFYGFKGCQAPILIDFLSSDEIFGRFSMVDPMRILVDFFHF